MDLNWKCHTYTHTNSPKALFSGSTTRVKHENIGKCISALERMERKLWCNQKNQVIGTLISEMTV